MRRFGQLYQRFLSLETFKEAWLRARLGKSTKAEVIEFSRNPEANLTGLIDSLRTGTYLFGVGKVFTIHDPKERVIHAPCFSERVVQHALMLALDPLFEDYQIYDSYACRRGKGTQAAVLRAFRGVKANRYFLKLDVRKYFDSVDHVILASMLRRRIKDPAILATLDLIIDSYETEPGKGLPIGNLTSQYFANHYLAGLDHLVIQKPRQSRAESRDYPYPSALGPARWIRYMDDMVLFSNNLAELSTMEGRIRRYCKHELELVLKPAVLDRSDRGLPFLGLLVKPSGIFLTRKTKTRFVSGYRSLEREFGLGRMGESEFALRSMAMVARTELARAISFRHHIIYGRVLGDEPRAARGQLEQ